MSDFNKIEKDNINVLSPFKLLVLQNFPFIEADFDAITNYQLMCKMAEYMNNINTNVNTLNENENRVYNAFNEIVDYINNYFNNLDVQEEINKKLDNLASDGTLTELIESYVNPYINTQNIKIQQIENKVNSVASGSPLVASSISEMTDTTRVYVNTTDGRWYYYNGSSWVAGGTYQSTGIGEETVAYKELSNYIKSQIKISIPDITYTDGSYIGASTGDIVSSSSSANYSYTSLITLKKGSSIGFTCSGTNTVASLAPYDEESQRYRTALLTNISTSSENDFYYTNNTNRDIKVSICGIKTSIKNIRIYNTIIGLDNIDNDYNLKLTFNDLPIILKDSNYTNYIQDKCINYNNGNELSINGAECTDYIEILPNQSIILNAIKVFKSSPDLRGLAFYNENKEYISGVQFPNNNTITTTTPKLAKYIRITRAFGMIVYYTSLKNIIESPNVLENKINTINGLELYKSFLHVGVIGDSLASGASAYKENDVEHWLDNYNYSWPQYMARSSGNTYYNFSKGGLTTKTWLTNEHGYPLASDGNHPCEAYIIGLGVNDINYVSLGSSTDIDLNDYHNNADTYYGNYAGIIQRMKELYPKAKFFLLTLPRAGTNNENYNTAIRYMTTIFDNCYIVDLYENYLPYYTTGSFIESNKRGGHYNAIAYNYMAQIISKAISEIMYKNYNEFKQVEFINTNYEY